MCPRAPGAVSTPRPGFPQLEPVPAAGRLALDTCVLGVEAPAQCPLAINTCSQCSRCEPGRRWRAGVPPRPGRRREGRGVRGQGSPGSAGSQVLTQERSELPELGGWGGRSAQEEAGQPSKGVSSPSRNQEPFTLRPGFQASEQETLTQEEDPHPCPDGFPFRVQSGCACPRQPGPSPPQPTRSQPVINRRLPGQCWATSHFVLSPTTAVIFRPPTTGEWRCLRREAPASRYPRAPDVPFPGQGGKVFSGVSLT